MHSTILTQQHASIEAVFPIDWYTYMYMLFIYLNNRVCFFIQSKCMDHTVVLAYSLVYVHHTVDRIKYDIQIDGMMMDLLLLSDFDSRS